MVAKNSDDEENSLGFEDEILKLNIQNSLGFSLDSLSSKELIRLIIQLYRKSSITEESLKESLKNFSSVTFEVKQPEFEKPELGLYTNLVLKHLESIPPDTLLYYRGKSYTSAYVYHEIKQQTEEGLTWLNFLVSNSISLLTENQLQEFSYEDVALVDSIVKEKQVSIYTAIKVLKKLVDRISSTAYRTKTKVDNSLFLENSSFVKLLEKLSQAQN